MRTAFISFVDFFHCLVYSKQFHIHNSTFGGRISPCSQACFLNITVAHNYKNCYVTQTKVKSVNKLHSKEAQNLHVILRKYLDKARHKGKNKVKINMNVRKELCTMRTRCQKSCAVTQTCITRTVSVTKLNLSQTNQPTQLTGYILYKEEKLSYIGRVGNGLEDLLIVFNGIPADGQYATTCWSE